MQIPIDMTTFTYCIFALGHILARQFPIVGFRPPVRLIDIIGRAADTRLHFYLHTFADQFARSPAIRSLLSLCCCSRIGIFRFLLSPPCSATPTIGRRFGCPAEARCWRVYARASDFYARGNAHRCNADGNWRSPRFFARWRRDSFGRAQELLR